jgi:hypothetical protein
MRTLVNKTALARLALFIVCAALVVACGTQSNKNRQAKQQQQQEELKKLQAQNSNLTAGNTGVPTELDGYWGTDCSQKDIDGVDGAKSRDDAYFFQGTAWYRIQQFYKEADCTWSDDQLDFITANHATSAGFFSLGAAAADGSKVINFSFWSTATNPAYGIANPQGPMPQWVIKKTSQFQFDMSMGNGTPATTYFQYDYVLK